MRRCMHCHTGDIRRVIRSARTCDTITGCCPITIQHMADSYRPRTAFIDRRCGAHHTGRVRIGVGCWSVTAFSTVTSCTSVLMARKRISESSSCQERAARQKSARGVIPLGKPIQCMRVCALHDSPAAAATPASPAGRRAPRAAAPRRPGRCSRWRATWSS